MIGIISQDGIIRGCNEESYNEIICRDRLREFVANEDSENKDILSESDKSELIYKIFSYLVLGGGLCQEDYNINNYIDIAKKLYKDIVRVHKDPKTKEIKSAVSAYQVTNVYYKNGTLFPNLEINQKCFIVVDKPKKAVILFYSPYIPYF